MFAVPSFFGYNTTFVSTPVATAATGVGSTSFTANWNAFAGASYYLLDVSTSSSFSSFVGSYQNFVVLSTSQLVSGLTASTTYYYRLRAATGVDADAAAFFSRIYTAGGALSYTEVSATETLVANMKSAGIWTSMKAVYPMIGASAAACAQNLKSSSFTGTFTSGWTFASTGVTPNGTSAYMNTGLSPNTTMNFNSQSYFIYKTTVQASTVCEFGVVDTARNGVNLFLNDGFNTINENVGNEPFTASTIAGAYILSRNNSNDKKLFRNGSLFQTKTSVATNYTLGNLYLSARPRPNSIIEFYSNTQTRFFSIGDGLTDTQASDFYTAVQAFQTTLSRNV